MGQMKHRPSLAQIHLYRKRGMVSAALFARADSRAGWHSRWRLEIDKGTLYIAIPIRIPRAQLAGCRALPQVIFGDLEH